LLCTRPVEQVRAAQVFWFLEGCVLAPCRKHSQDVTQSLYLMVLSDLLAEHLRDKRSALFPGLYRARLEVNGCACHLSWTHLSVGSRHTV
jgi:hypothetical protein